MSSNNISDGDNSCQYEAEAEDGGEYGDGDDSGQYDKDEDEDGGEDDYDDGEGEGDSGVDGDDDSHCSSEELEDEITIYNLTDI